MFMQENINTGRVGTVGEFKIVKIGEKDVPVIELDIATDGFHNKDTGETETLWLKFSVFGDKAESVANHLQPGDIIQVKYQVVNDIQVVQGVNVHGFKLRLLGLGFVWLKKWGQNQNAEN